MHLWSHLFCKLFDVSLTKHFFFAFLPSSTEHFVFDLKILCVLFESVQIACLNEIKVPHYRHNFLVIEECEVKAKLEKVYHRNVAQFCH